MPVRTLTIDNQDVSANETETILEAAAGVGVTIPTLCHLQGVEPVGACRLCLVEIEGSSKLQPACITRVSEGMVIHTQTERLQSYRKMILELLFAERNHVCSVCVANRHCELQDLAVSQGMTHVRFDYVSPRETVDLTHPLFGADHHRCILCTRCVRVCDEIEGAHTWDVAGRGAATHVITDLGEPWGDSTTCTSCGKCVQACPTGALFRKGSSVEEMTKDRDRLRRLVLAREGEWLV